MNRHYHPVREVINRGVPSLLVGICLLGIGTVQAGGGTVKFHQTRYLYTDLPQSIACRLCTGLARSPMQDTNNFVYCTPCLKTVRDITQAGLGLPLIGGDTAALRQAFPHSPHEVLLLVRSFGQELQVLEQPKAVGHDELDGDSRKNRSFFTTASPSIQARVKGFELKCQDCQKTVLHKDAKKHAATHIVGCSCRDYSPSGEDGGYPHFADRVRKLKQHILEANSRCRYCSQEVGHLNITRHEAYCPEKEVVCPVCQDTMTIGRLPVHVTREAFQSHSSIACPLCENGRRIHGLGFARHMATQHSPQSRVQGECPFCQNHRWTLADTDLVAHVALSHPEEYVHLSVCGDQDSLSSEAEKSLYQLITTWVAPPVPQDSQQIVGEIVHSSPYTPWPGELPAPERDLATLAASVEKLSFVQDVMGFASYDGHTTWRIPNYRWQKNRVFTAQAESIHSPPFYLGRHGYKFCLRAYLNGDGLGKGTHLSLFLVLLMGEFDTLLTFPLDAKVTMKVLNQRNSENSVKSFFRTDVNSASWGRPATGENRGAGLPLMISHEKLEKDNAGYLDNDTLYIDCRVKLNQERAPKTADRTRQRSPEHHAEETCTIW